MANKYFDTYFLDSKQALEVAKKNNRVDCTSAVTGTQICYYAGKELKNAPKNCINLPLESIYEHFRDTSFRIPTKIAYENSQFTREEQKTLTQKITQTIEQSIYAQKKLILKYEEKIRQITPDFKNERLRVFIPSSRLTTVMQHVSKYIANAFKKMGYEVMYLIEENDMHYSSYLLQVKAHYEYNPHITVHINHFNNDYLHKKIFNIVWMQDPMESIVNPVSCIKVRKRDLIYSLAAPIDYALKKKNIPFNRQNFAINKKIYKTKDSIERKKKIVFVGSAYFTNVHKDTPKELFDEILDMFIKGIDFSEPIITRLARKYNLDFIYVIIRVINFIIRDYSVLELCKINTEYEIEIYGWGWDKYPETKPYYKGVLKYGEDIAKVFHSATYSLSPHSCSIVQQRVLEASACGCIPIVYDCRSIEPPPFYEDNLIYYKDLKTLTTILKESPIKKPKKIIKENSYKKLVKRFIKDMEGT